MEKDIYNFNSPSYTRGLDSNTQEISFKSPQAQSQKTIRDFNFVRNCIEIYRYTSYISYIFLIGSILLSIIRIIQVDCPYMSLLSIVDILSTLILLENYKETIKKIFLQFAKTQIALKQIAAHTVAFIFQVVAFVLGYYEGNVCASTFQSDISSTNYTQVYVIYSFVKCTYTFMLGLFVLVFCCINSGLKL